MAASFAQFANTWANVDGEMALLHQMQAARREFMLQHLIKGMEGQRGLDVGCGGGINAIDLASLGYDMTAIDCEQDLINVAQNQANDRHLMIDFQVASIAQFQPSELFDFICCYEVLEHVDDPQKSCQQLLSWLKPGGLIFISTINKTLRGYLVAIGLGEYLLKYLPIGTHDFEKFISHQDLNHFLAPAFCHDIRGMIYNPLERRFFLGESLSVQYIGVWRKEDDHR